MGKHNAPKQARTATAAKALTPIGVATVLLSVGGTAEAAVPTNILDQIAFCESTNNENASNGTHFGLFQFDLPTWRSVGGTGDPRNASRTEQYNRAAVLLQQRGTQPWNASRHCWGAENAVKAGTRVATAVAVKTPKAATPVGTYTIKRGDTLSQIANTLGVKGGWRALASLNRQQVPNPNMLKIGMTLKVQ